MLLLYDVIFFFFALAYLPVFLLKGKHRHGLSERFGIVPEEIREKLKGRKVFWLHAVSVGEVTLAVRFADAIRKKDAEAQMVLTTTTSAGWDVANKLKDENDVLLYFPVDFGFAVRSFIRSVSPKAVIILETEIWPNLMTELSRLGIPVFIVNGRISDKGIGTYRLVRFFLRRILRCVAAIGAQDERMKERFLELGAEPGRVGVTGNLKYDWVPSDSRDAPLEDLKHRLKTGANFWLVAGSTHENEEELLFELYPALKERFPNFRLLIAPRHLERLASIEQRAAQKNIPVKKVSSLEQNGSSDKNSEGVLLLDQMGVLAFWYQLADAVFMGGSLVPVGGHNLVEPAYFKKPILFGPFMQNFTEMADEFQKNGAAIQVRDAKDLKQKLMELFQDKEKRERLGLAAKRLVLSHQGAVQKNIEMVFGGLKS